VRGTVTMAGRPKFGCKVVFGRSLEALNRGLDAPGPSPEAAITGPGGEYSFTGVEPGAYLVAVPGCELLTTTTRVSVTSGETARVDFSC
jgi:hypothetical protein